ncbi:putative MCE family protein [Nocardioides phosphati]|uniref:MCE family protein n=1 Tax=Nocardioides phosphati TaxID=1867775 RepID=A0ABQ2NB50_9ACTN|nr:MlaD family protein [Nocardioides phosphati]GGO91218.1 putative MCE family protein [Nocardioides phosphati]
MLKKFDKLVLSFIALIAVFVLLMIYMVTAVLKLPLTGSPDRITVHMAQTGGLFEGSAVNYRGVRVGTITDIRVGKTGPDATVTFKNGAKVPTSAKAEVVSLSPIGEQFLNLIPTSTQGPFLKDGAQINAAAVSLPITVASAADNLDKFLDEINDKDVKILLHELNAAVSDSSDDLDHLLTSSNELVSTLDDAWPRTDALLHNGLTVNQILARHQQDLVSFSASAKELTAWLVKFDPTFQRILKNAPSDLRTVGQLIDDLGPLLPALLKNLNATTNILADRDASVRALAQVTPGALGKVTASLHGGWWYLRAFLDGEAICDYGGPKANPSVIDPNPVNRNGHCGSSPARWRGANHALPPIDK